MATTTVLRPSATSSGVGWSAVPSGTLNGVTSDDSDATYALWSGTGSALILPTPADAPPAGERRHQVRLRMRGEDGNAWGAVRLASGALVAGAAAAFPASPATVNGAWGFGVPPDGSTVVSAYVTGQSTGVKIEELYIDVDSRLAPTFTPQVLDSSGTPSVTITDTSQPSLLASSPNLDGLSARQFRYWVTLGATIVWDSGVVSGPSAPLQTDPLDNGSYVAHFQIWSTLAQTIAYASDEETLAFTVTVGTVPKPDNPTVDQVDGTPFYHLNVCAPYAGDFDGAQAWIEIQRVDCDKSVTVAILGPLATDECADYTDYSHPRTGLGATCDHGPAACCSYYRARTLGRIDDQLQISNWSDAFDTGMPSGLIAMWPSTAASLPTGWRRTTALDAKYPKGIATTATQPGATGGALTHTHTVPTHTHDTSHTHTVTGASGAASGTTPAADGATGTTAILSSHTHTIPTTGGASVTASGTATPGIGDGTNDPSRLHVIFMESDGTPDGIPVNALAFSPDTSLSGWTDYANATGRFIKGTAPAGDGGATAASLLDAHNHSVAAHSHTGPTHQHTSLSQSVTSNKSLFAGSVQALWTGSHQHTVTAASIAASALATNAAGVSGNSSGSGALDPPFRNIRVKQNGNGAPDLPVGVVCAWRGSLGAIPDFWQLCDGTNGTLDMTARYPKGATSSIGTTGGSLNPHSHTSPSHSDHSTTGHSHTQSLASSGAATAAISNTATVVVALGTHTHTAPSTNSTTPTVGSSTSGTLANTTTEPPYEEVAFVQLMETPTPPPDPEETCLTWDEDYHLIRSENASGPLWAQVGGLITWDRDRPFTSATGVMGKRFITSATPGGRNFHLTAAVSSEAELAQLQAVLNRPLVLVSPSDSAEMWAAPVASSVKVIRIGRIRQVTADFIGTGPQPSPQLADVGA
jgi:hypothetical protein